MKASMNGDSLQEVVQNNVAHIKHLFK